MRDQPLLAGSRDRGTYYETINGMRFDDAFRPTPRADRCGWSHWKERANGEEGRGERGWLSGVLFQPIALREPRCSPPYEAGVPTTGRALP